MTSLRSRRERELSVTDNSQGRAVMKHYGHQGFAVLVKTAQSIELLSGAGIAAVMEFLGIKIEKVMAIRHERAHGDCQAR